MAILVAIAVNEDGYREVLGAAEGMKEDKASWVSGYPDNTFRPNSPITRAEVSVIVNDMLGRDTNERFIDQHDAELVSFGDLPKDHWTYYDVMEATNSHNNSKESWTRLITGA